LVRSHETSALKLLESLRPAMIAGGYEGQFQKLNKQLHSYQFSEALQLLASMANRNSGGAES
ncbi:MAG: hypothetical protein RIF32_18905, partial [Leptospirales bacterium]